MQDRGGFARTTCACPADVENCQSQPGACAPGDVEAIAEHLGLPLAEALQFFWASPGALLGNTQTGETFRVGTITPRFADGRCVFLSGTGCMVHPVAPFGCAVYDVHQQREEWMPKSLYLVRRQMEPAYQLLRSALPPATHYKPRRA